jgi:hypothetical protein
MPQAPMAPLMAPKIDTTQKLGPHGRTVHITGPIGGWNGPSVAAIFTVVVSQVAVGGDTVVTAIGESDHTYEYDDHATDWAATATVLGDSGESLQVGGATVTAWATYADSDGAAWSYQWTLPVRLQDH